MAMETIAPLGSLKRPSGRNAGGPSLILQNGTLPTHPHPKTERPFVLDATT